MEDKQDALFIRCQCGLRHHIKEIDIKKMEEDVKQQLEQEQRSKAPITINQNILKIADLQIQSYDPIAEQIKLAEKIISHPKLSDYLNYTRKLNSMGFNGVG